MTLFFVLASITVIAGVLAMALRNLVHCALALAVCVAGLAAVYLQLNAQFIGFAQLLVYVGAVAVLILFSILLTRGFETSRTFSSGWGVGIGTSLLVFGILCFSVLKTRLLTTRMEPSPEIGVLAIGKQLMSNYILPLQIAGLLLTAALIGAVLMAMREDETRP